MTRSIYNSEIEYEIHNSLLDINNIWYHSMSKVYFLMTTGKTIGLTRWTFVGKVMSLLFPSHYNQKCPYTFPESA